MHRGFEEPGVKDSGGAILKNVSINTEKFLYLLLRFSAVVLAFGEVRISAVVYNQVKRKTACHQT
jgi:hypothetical protein